MAETEDEKKKGEPLKPQWAALGGAVALLAGGSKAATELLAPFVDALGLSEGVFKTCLMPVAVGAIVVVSALTERWNIFTKATERLVGWRKKAVAAFGIALVIAGVVAAVREHAKEDDAMLRGTITTMPSAPCPGGESRVRLDLILPKGVPDLEVTLAPASITDYVGEFVENDPIIHELPRPASDPARAPFHLESEQREWSASVCVRLDPSRESRVPPLKVLTKGRQVKLEVKDL